MLARKSFSAVERSDKKPNDCAPTRKVNTASVVSGSANSKGLKARTATQCSNTTFSDAYSKGLIPCKLLHGSVSNKLGWSVESLGELSFDPLLVNFFEGLVDTRHPYAFLVAQGNTHFTIYSFLFRNSTASELSWRVRKDLPPLARVGQATEERAWIKRKVCGLVITKGSFQIGADFGNESVRNSSKCIASASLENAQQEDEDWYAFFIFVTFSQETKSPRL